MFSETAYDFDRGSKLNLEVKDLRRDSQLLRGGWRRWRGRLHEPSLRCPRRKGKLFSPLACRSPNTAGPFPAPQSTASVVSSPACRLAVHQDVSFGSKNALTPGAGAFFKVGGWQRASPILAGGLATARKLTIRNFQIAHWRSALASSPRATHSPCVVWPSPARWARTMNVAPGNQ